MTKRDLAYVLVKLSGFSWIVLAVFTSISRLTNLLADVIEHRDPGTSFGYAWVLTPLAQVVLAILLIRQAGRIVNWLLRDDKA